MLVSRLRTVRHFNGYRVEGMTAAHERFVLLELPIKKL